MLTSNCEVWVELDAENPVFQPGDVLSGEVHVEVDDDVKCDVIYLEVGWYTHGRGNSVTNTAIAVPVCPETQWSPGTHSYDFEVELPNGPFSYHGHYLNVDWWVEAHVDIPWAIDPKSELEFVLQPGPTSKQLAYAPDDRNLQIATGALSTSEAVRTGIGVVMILVALFLLAVIGMGGILVAGFLGAFGLILGISGAWRMAAESKLGTVEIDIDPQYVAPSSSLHCKVSFTPRSDATVNAISAHLVGKEVVVRGSGTNRTTYTHTLYEDWTPLAETIEIAKGNSFSISREISVPENAPFSFDARDNEIEWSCVVHIDIDGWPDWKRDCPIVVTPPKRLPPPAGTDTTDSENQAGVW